MSGGSTEGEGKRSEEQKAANLDADTVLNVADNLKAMLKDADDGLVNDLAFEILYADPRLTLALTEQVEKLLKKAA